jgi:hypothetical protein
MRSSAALAVLSELAIVFSFLLTNCQTPCLTNSLHSSLHAADRCHATSGKGGSDPTMSRDAPCVKGWGRSRPSEFLPRASGLFFGVYLPCFSQVLLTAKVK